MAARSPDEALQHEGKSAHTPAPESWTHGSEVHDSGAGVWPKDEECAKELKKWTLTNLYNQRPAWLDNVHRELDAAVAAAYGWPADLSDDEILARLFELNQARAGRFPAAAA